MNKKAAKNNWYQMKLRLLREENQRLTQRLLEGCPDCREAL